MKRHITDAETEEILKLKPDDVDDQLMRDFFAVYKGQDHPRFNTFDSMTLKANKLYNKTKIETTVGRYLFNMFAIPEKYLKKYGYQNITFDKKGCKNFEVALFNMLLEDEVNADDICLYMDRSQWITMNISYFITPTLNYDFNLPVPEVIKKRDELFEKHKDELKKGNVDILNSMETELVGMAKKAVEKKPSYDFYRAGVGDFANNYKKACIMGGAIENPGNHKLDIVKSNYIDGISKEEFPIMVNLTITGGYARNIETAKSGYETKKLNNAMQSVVLDPAGSDCHTTEYLHVKIDKSLASMFLLRYIREGSRDVLLTSDNINHYIGKDVLLRSPMFCKSKTGICSKCAGELYHKMGVKNVGLLASTLSGALLNKMLKKFHDATIRFDKIDPDEYIIKR